MRISFCSSRPVDAHLYYATVSKSSLISEHSKANRVVIESLFVFPHTLQPTLPFIKKKRVEILTIAVCLLSRKRGNVVTNKVQVVQVESP